MRKLHPFASVIARLTLFVLVSLPFNPVQGRQPAPGQFARETNPFLKRNLDELLAEVERLKLPENQLTIYHRLFRAALRVDRARGIEIAGRAVDLASSLASRNLEKQGEMPDELHQLIREEQRVFGIYRDVLLGLAEVDPGSASRLLAGTRSRLNKPGVEPRASELADLEYRIEIKVLMGRKDDPNQLAEALRRSFETGTSEDFKVTLRSLMGKFPEVARRETENLLTRLDQREGGFSWRAIRHSKVGEFLDVISAEFPVGLLYRPNKQPDARMLGEHSRAVFFKVLGEVCLATIIAAQQRTTRKENVPGAMEDAFSDFKKYTYGMTTQPPELTRMLSQVMAERPRDEGDSQSPEQPVHQRTLEEILAAAERATLSGEFNTLIEEAAHILGGKGRIPEGQDLLNRIRGNFPRQAALERFERQFVQSRARGPMQVQPVRQTQESKDQRFHRLVYEATQSIDKKDLESATTRLNEAVQVIGGEIPKSAGHYQNLLRVAEVFARYEPASAERILARLISKMNDALDATAVLDGFAYSAFPQFKDGEFQLQYESYLNRQFFNVAESIARIGKSNQSAVSQLLAKVRRPEIRAWLWTEIVSAMA